MAPLTSCLLSPQATITCTWVNCQQEKPLYVQPMVQEMLHQAAQVYKQEHGLQKEIYSQSLVRRKQRWSTMTVFLEKLEQEKKRMAKCAAKAAGKRPAPSSTICQLPIHSVHLASAPLCCSSPPPRHIITHWQCPHLPQPQMFEPTHTVVEQYQHKFCLCQAERTS